MVSEIIKSFTDNTNDFSSKINTSVYTEGNNPIIEERGVNDICEIIIGNNSILYDSMDDNHKGQYIIKEKLTIASTMELKKTYSNVFNSSLITIGLQSKNYLSSILYLNEHYGINVVVFNKEINKYYKTTVKDYPKLFCRYQNNSWFINDFPQIEPEYSDDVSELSNILTIDCPTIIWKPGYFALSKYKLEDLKKYCIDRSIPLVHESGKKKLKKELYDNLNLNYYINQ
jgi:hypothetical protein